MDSGSHHRSVRSASSFQDMAEAVKRAARTEELMVGRLLAVACSIGLSKPGQLIVIDEARHQHDLLVEASQWLEALAPHEAEIRETIGP